MRWSPAVPSVLSTAYPLFLHSLVSSSSLSSDNQGLEVPCPELGVVLRLGGGSRSLHTCPEAGYGLGRPRGASAKVQRHLAVSTNPQDLEHHLLVIPGFSGNLTSLFLHFIVTAQPGGQAAHATEEEKGGGTFTTCATNTSTASCACCRTPQKNARENISSTKPLSWGHPLLFTSPSSNRNNKLSHWHNHPGTLLRRHFCLVAVSNQRKMLLEHSNLFIPCTAVALGSVMKGALLAAGSQAARCGGDHRSVCKYRSGGVQPFGMRERKINATSPLRATGNLHLSNCTS